MKEGCEAFLAGWEEDIVQVLVNRIDTDSAVRQLCYDISQACQNVDPGNVKPFDDTIMIDGQPTKIVNRLINVNRIKRRKKIFKCFLFSCLVELFINS